MCLKTLGIILVSFILFVIFIAVGNVGVGNTIMFIIVFGFSGSIIAAISEQSKTLGIIMAILWIIVLCCVIWNAAFNWEM
jgi:hypothetical protein